MTLYISYGCVFSLESSQKMQFILGTLVHPTQVEHWSPVVCASIEDHLNEIINVMESVCFGTSVWPEANCTQPQSLGMGPGLQIYTLPIMTVAIAIVWSVLSTLGYLGERCRTLETWSELLVILWGLVLFGSKTTSSYMVSKPLDNYGDATWTVAMFLLQRTSVVLLSTVVIEWILVQVQVGVVETPTKTQEMVEPSQPE